MSQKCYTVAKRIGNHLLKMSTALRREHHFSKKGATVGAKGRVAFCTGGRRTPQGTLCGPLFNHFENPIAGKLLGNNINRIIPIMKKNRPALGHSNNQALTPAMSCSVFRIKRCFPHRSQRCSIHSRLGDSSGAEKSYHF